jgi:hypothetical protein
MAQKKTSNKLNRFTTLPFLIDLLKNGSLILLSPKTWEDHNDTDILMDYKDKKKIVGLLALCFTDQSETIHHWKAFSSNESGCCIEFDKTKLLDLLSKDKRIKHKKVNYPTVINSNIVATDDIPFTKRYPYKCEQEYRVIMKHEENVLFHPIAIQLDLITKITLSPNLPKPTFNTIKEILQSLMDNHKIPINHSSLFENRDWIDGFKNRSTVGP